MKILELIHEHDKKFGDEHQNPEVITRKMRRIAKRYFKIEKILDNWLPIKKFFRLLFVKPSQMAPKNIIGHHKNRKWKEQGMESEWEWNNTRINRVRNYKYLI